MEALHLHSRQKNLLSVLSKKHGAVSGKELATALDVSERTIRSDIKEINSQLETYGIQICPLYGKGYSLSIKDRHVFVELFSERESYASKDDRVRTLMIRLLRENDWCELGTLEDEMFVSRTTLENDLKTVKKKISARHPYLQMERKGNFVRLENNEIKRRDILIRNYVEYWDYDSREGIILKRDEVGIDVLRSIQTVLKEALLKWDINFDDSAFIYMTMAIALMYYRTTQGHPIQYMDKDRSFSEVSEFIRDVVERLNRSWNLDLEQSEYIWLSDIAKQLIVFSDTSRSKNSILKNTDILCHHIVNNLLNSINREYGMDFTTDDSLFIDLTLHVQALFDGIVAPSIQSHILGDELRLKFPFLGDIVHFTRKYLEEQCEIELGNDEEDYLFPFIISAYRAAQKKCIGSGIVTSVISHTNNSITHYLIEQLNSRYKDSLDLRGPYPIHAKNKATLDAPALILSTARVSGFKTPISCPVIVVSPLLERSERLMIDIYIERYVCHKLFGAFPKPLEQLLPKELVFNINNKESLITTLSSIRDTMYHKKYIGNIRSADPSVDYNTLLRNGFLFIYQVDNSVPEPVFSLATLNKSISWKHLRSVQSIIYLALPEKCRKKLGLYYFIAKCLSVKPEFLPEILSPM